VKERILDMTLNGSGIRDISRVLEISPTTVIEELKSKSSQISQVNQRALNQLNPEDVEVEIRKAEVDAEADEMWGFVGKKENQRWLWHAIDHYTGVILAYVLGTREDEVFLQLKALLKPFGIHKFYTDGAKVYERHLQPQEHQTGKENTQKIERKHLTLRTRIKRLVRKTICFSKSIFMHDLVIGLFITTVEFGLVIT
jgi:IS1 family transposase